MGQKIHPIGFRLSVQKNWTSKWYANSKNFAGMLLKDIEVRDYLRKSFSVQVYPRLSSNDQLKMLKLQFILLVPVL